MIDPAAVSFEQVRNEELAHVAPAARQYAAKSAAAGIEVVSAPAAAPAVSALAGLAFSGGGIRSATFCLGVLQALALKEKLRSFDYLSTVSGGGYIGSWFSAWVHRQGFAAVETALKQSAATGSEDPAEVQWLRRYSNYLTPRVGMLSTDAMTVVATWLRNVFLNALILVALIGAMQFALVAALPLVDSLILHPQVNGYLTLALVDMALAAIAWNLTLQYRRAVPNDGVMLQQKWVVILVVIPLLAAAVTGAAWLLAQKFYPGAWIEFLPIVVASLAVAMPVGWVGAIRTNGNMATIPTVAAMQPGERGAARQRLLRDAITYTLAAAVAVGVGAGLCVLLTNLWPYLPVDIAEPDLQVSADLVAPIMTFGPSVVLLIFGICISLWIGLAGRRFREDSREWWSRLGGWIIFLALCWMAFMLLTFYVPPWIAAAYDLGPVWGKAIAGSAWVASIPVVFKVLGTINHDKPRGTKLKKTVVNIAVAVFAIGIFVLIAVAVGSLINYLSGATYPAEANTVADYEAAFFNSLDDLRDKSLPSVPWLSLAFTCCAAGAAIALLLAWRVDINRFSLHNLYKNRLIRCYLGASNERRNAQPFTGFDREDDLPLKDLATIATGEPQRPFHIINTAINLVQGADLAWQERKAASFVLTPKYCGFQLGKSQGNSNPKLTQPELLAFRPTAQYASEDPGGEDDGFSLGMAMATSGAAASPNQGFHSQPALAVLMTFLNIRLGRWSPNPAKGAWKKASPKLGLAYLIAELTGNTNESRDFVYLSDGGHFENMAVYELVRRKCSVIVAVDCGADPNRAFDDLGNMIRKCRIDFGVEIEIELTSLFGEGDSNLSAESHAVGTIYYNKNDRSAPQGKLIYIKPSLKKLRLEAVDLLNYKTGDNSFPQQTTADQWFDESQFESYRKLGFEVASDCMNKHGHLLTSAHSLERQGLN